jgi:hypothetical protein
LQGVHPAFRFVFPPFFHLIFDKLRDYEVLWIHNPLAISLICKHYYSKNNAPQVLSMHVKCWNDKHYYFLCCFGG